MTRARANKRLDLKFGIAVALLILLPRASFAVNGNFYRYSVRHEKGASPFFPFMPVESESVNSANGNLFFTIPLVSRPGRAGLGVNLSLAYNSHFWEHLLSTSGSVYAATIAEKDSWVGVGWTLLVARIIEDPVAGMYYVTLSDGSNHELPGYDGQTWRSRDSSYMIYNPYVQKLTLKGGLTLTFNYVDPLDSSVRYATKVQDSNGNYLEINYGGTGSRISNIQDTLGNTYTFVLTGDNRLL